MWMLVIIHTPATNFLCGFDILSDPLVSDMVAILLHVIMLTGAHNEKKHSGVLVISAVYDQIW